MPVGLIGEGCLEAAVVGAGFDQIHLLWRKGLPVFGGKGLAPFDAMGETFSIRSEGEVVSWFACGRTHHGLNREIVGGGVQAEGVFDEQREAVSGGIRLPHFRIGHDTLGAPEGPEVARGRTCGEGRDFRSREGAGVDAEIVDIARVVEADVVQGTAEAGGEGGAGLDGGVGGGGELGLAVQEEAGFAEVEGAVAVQIIKNDSDMLPGVGREGCGAANIGSLDFAPQEGHAGLRIHAQGEALAGGGGAVAEPGAELRLAGGGAQPGGDRAGRRASGHVGEGGIEIDALAGAVETRRAAMAATHPGCLAAAVAEGLALDDSVGRAHGGALIFIEGIQRKPGCGAGSGGSPPWLKALAVTGALPMEGPCQRKSKSAPLLPWIRRMRMGWVPARKGMVPEDFSVPGV